MRTNDKYEIELGLLKREFDEKLEKYGEERDVMQRKINIYEKPLPSD